MGVDARRTATLLAKDARLQASAFEVLVLFELGTFLTFVAQFPPPMRATAGVLLQGTAAIGTFVMAYRSVAVEDSGGTIRFLKSLPLSTSDIYGSKFAFMALYVLANAAALNVLFAVCRALLPWDMAPVTVQAVVVGLVVQLGFAAVLVAVATLSSSEKAVWVPFPVVVVLLNLYTVTSSREHTAGSSVLQTLSDAWAAYSLLGLLLVLALVLVVVRLLGRKTSLVG